MQKTIVVTFVLFAIFAGGILLQIFLSRKESKWFGLILPFITFAYSLLVLSQIVKTDIMTWWNTVGLIASTFFISNIPTIILLAIYFGCREKIKRKKAIEKMSIQDL
ncbi:MAG: hypothetical protein IKI49_05885 [Oscillospiraceae bacterium]|nr:hypothetical protein [Oscillospiraceae bacterium]